MKRWSARSAGAVARGGAGSGESRVFDPFIDFDVLLDQHKHSSQEEFCLLAALRPIGSSNTRSVDKVPVMLIKHLGTRVAFSEAFSSLPALLRCRSCPFYIGIHLWRRDESWGPVH